MLIKSIMDETSNFGPSATVVDGRHYVAWIGLDGRLNVTQLGGQKLTLDTVNPGVGGIALASRPGPRFDLMLAATDPRGPVFTMPGTSDPLSFNVGIAEPTQINSFTAPAVAAFNGIYFLAFAAPDGQIFVERAPELGLTPTPAIPIATNEFTFAPPALAAFDNRLFLAWVGNDGLGHLNIASSQDGLHFGNKVTLPDFSKHGPGLAQFDAALVLAWTGDDGQGHLNTFFTPDGAVFPPGAKDVEADTSSGSLALVDMPGPTFAHQLMIHWAGTDNPHHLNVGTLLEH